MKAIWKNTVIAESDDTVLVEGNHYFPMSSLNKELIEISETTTNCPWKGTANYYSIKTNGALNKDAVWFYKTPKKAAQQIENRIAFWNGVEIIE